MRRVLVPVDGTETSMSILPDARRLAGPDGTIVLVRDAGSNLYNSSTFVVGIAETQEIDDHLAVLAHGLRSEGVNAEAHTLVLVDAAEAIDTAARAYNADVIACATHGRGPLGRFIRGGVAWKALAHSPVPVLLRHVDADTPFLEEPRQRRIMVPLDGSSYAARALPLARQLAAEWDAELLLVRVIVPMPAPIGPYIPNLSEWDQPETEHEVALRYLRRMANGDPKVQIAVQVGSVCDQLMSVVKNRGITDVVMASHGRTGLSRMVLGSVADQLIHDLRCPVVVVPSLVGVAETEEESARDMDKEPVGV